MEQVHTGKWWWLGAALAGIVLGTLFFVDPVGVSWFPPCIFHRLTGLDCPGCGSGRGLHALLHGELLRAADYNVLLLPALPLLASGFYFRLTGKGRNLWHRLDRPWAMLWIICLFWILRNIPGMPWSWLSSAE